MATILSSSVLDLSSSASESDEEILGFEIDAFKKYQTSASSTTVPSGDFRMQKRIEFSSSLDPGPSTFKEYVNVNPTDEKGAHVKHNYLLQKELDESLKKSVIHQPGFEKMKNQPAMLSRHQIRKQRLKERDKTKGFQWFNMPATEITEEKKNDLMLLTMRNAIDPTLHYKRNSFKKLPKYFQVGTVIEPPVDFYSSRIPKKMRKQTLVEELIADAEFRRERKALAPKKQHYERRNFPLRSRDRKDAFASEKVGLNSKEMKKKSRDFLKTL